MVSICAGTASPLREARNCVDRKVGLGIIDHSSISSSVILSFPSWRHRGNEPIVRGERRYS